MQQKSRRAFIVQAALVSVGLAILPHCKKKEATPPKEKKDIVIIGAGIAGLAAATTLKNSGYNVTVLEASDRIGGRILTQNIDGYSADFGASWIHGINGNPIYSLAAANNINTITTYYEPSYLFDTDGSEITEAEWSEVETLLEELVNLAYENSNISLEELLTIMGPNITVSDKIKRIFLGAVRSEIEIPYAVDSSEISAKALTTNDSFEGNDVIFPQGMSTLTNVLAQGLDIKYNSFVTKISYSGENVFIHVKDPIDIDPKRSCMACHSNTNASTLTDDYFLQADMVVVALPLGVLKHRIVEFEPSLPSDKLDAINRLGIGTMNKVFLKFNTNFWNTDGYFFQYIKEESSQIIEFFSPTPTGTSNIIIAVFAGQQARSIEKMDDAELKDIVMNDLKAMFGTNIPQPVSMHKTTWHTNPFSLGAYPHLAPGSDLSDCNILASPINNKVFFAGDATSEKYMATAHGAYISGIDAANNIIKL